MLADLAILSVNQSKSLIVRVGHFEHFSRVVLVVLKTRF